jgi:polyphosphate kinase 2 (PPK2 family)
MRHNISTQYLTRPAGEWRSFSQRWSTFAHAHEEAIARAREEQRPWVIYRVAYHPGSRKRDLMLLGTILSTGAAT